MNIEDILSMFTKEELTELKYILGDRIAKKYYLFNDYSDECVSLKDRFGYGNESTFRCLNEDETRSFVRKKISEFRDAVDRSNNYKELYKNLGIKKTIVYHCDDDEFENDFLQYGFDIRVIFEESIASYLIETYKSFIGIKEIENCILSSSNSNLVCVPEAWVIADKIDVCEIICPRNEDLCGKYYFLDLSIFMDELNNLGFNSYIDNEDNKVPVSYKNILNSNINYGCSFLVVVDKRLQKENGIDMELKKKIKK